MTNCVFDLKNLYRNTHNFSPVKYFTLLLVIFNTACGGGGGGGLPTSHSEMRMALDAGAVGYIPKNIGIKAFYSAMTLMAEGEIFLPADHGGHKSENSFLPENWLTGREQDMLAGLLGGKSNKEIARKHGLSEVTVKHHLKSLRGKLGAKNRTHAVCRAIELGIVPE